MCRNIKNLFNFDPPVTDQEVRNASLQFVRKISGFNKPSKANEASFNLAIDEIAAVAARLLHSLETTAQPKNREEEAAPSDFFVVSPHSERGRRGRNPLCFPLAFSLLHVIVRSLTRDDHIMHVALPQPGIRDANEPRFRL